MRALRARTRRLTNRADVVALERARDPLARLQSALVPSVMTSAEWTDIAGAGAAGCGGRDRARACAADCRIRAHVTRHVFSETLPMERGVQQQGGLAPEGVVAHARHAKSPAPEATRINMLTAIRRTLDVELAANPKLVVFGEDVGPKGGVHGATLGLQEKYGRARVFDTSLSEEGIIGRAVGMALAGLAPVAEIQFRKYAEPAAEQLNDCGTMRWRTHNRFAAPIVVRMPGGFFKCGDPWHSQTNEVAWLHGVGWRVAMPSNAEDAVGLLRAAMRGNDPTIFFEHRAMLDGAWARRPYPGDDFVVPFGKARCVRDGHGAHGRDLGCDGRAVRTGGGRLARGCRSDRPAHAVALGPDGRARLGAQDAALSHRSRRHADGRVWRRDRRRAREGGFLPPRCADRAR